MNTTKTLALSYAAKLVEYYEAKNSDHADKEHLVRFAYNELLVAQNDLAAAAEHEAVYGVTFETVEV